jgi:hypothetical protein
MTQKLHFSLFANRCGWLSIQRFLGFNMNVVELGGCRELLTQWDDVRKRIIRGEVHGWMVGVTTGPGVVLGGDMRADPAPALRATTRLAMGVALKLAQDVEAAQRARRLPRLLKARRGV